jgi:hypothetical protein
LPEKVWLQVFRKPPLKDVNNVHLVCRNLHQIANLRVNPILRLNRNPSQDLDSLVQSSRIFEELEFKYDVKEDEGKVISPIFNEHYLLYREKFEEVEKFIKITGPHIKKLTIIRVKVDPKFFQNLLNLLPNLEVLELDRVSIRASDEPIKWALKSRKIKRFKMHNCPAKIETLLEPLAECVIEEAELGFKFPTRPETIQNFLKSQEKNLKKLTINTYLHA